MSSSTIGLIIFACVFGGAMLGLILRALLPDHHLGAETKDVVKLGTGLIGTMSALVLGLLVASAKSSYDKQRDEVTELSANFLLLDRVLAHYGPESKVARDRLHATLDGLLIRIWNTGQPATTQSASAFAVGESAYDAILQLASSNDTQRKLQSEALSICMQLARQRMLLFEQAGSALSMPLLVVLVFWLSIIFLSFGLFAPRNATVIATLMLCALSVSGAMYIILELDRPFAGLIRISDVPVRHALSQLGK